MHLLIKINISNKFKIIEIKFKYLIIINEYWSWLLKRITMTLLQAWQTVPPQVSETQSRSYWGQKRQKRQKK